MSFVGGGRSENQRSTFEQNVMSTLEALNESMNQLKENPSISQTEVSMLYTYIHAVCRFVTMHA